MISEKDKLRFESKIDKQEDGCWIWKGFKAPSGYGSFWFNGGNVRAHRFSYAAYVGEIPEGALVCHKCDNRACVSPNCLWLGTYKENMQDCVKKGRKKVREESKVKIGLGGKRLWEHASLNKRKKMLSNLNRKGMSGKKHSDEVKKKISESHKGHVVSDNARIKIGNVHRGKIVSIETRLKIGKSKSKLTDKQVVNMRNEYKNGVKQIVLSKKYHIDPSDVSRIVNNKRYLHVK